MTENQKLTESRSSEMASKPEQLVTVAEVAATLSTLPVKVANMAGERLTTWWDGQSALTFADAQRIADVIREEQAEGDRRYLENLDAQQRAVDEIRRRFSTSSGIGRSATSARPFAN
jgi:hypothetical protein